jgi:spermidine synthase
MELVQSTPWPVRYHSALSGIDFTPPLSPASRRFLPLLVVLFVGSGCAALIYEVVWFQLLQLVIGSSAVSLGVLLGTYMGGMCLGSLLLPRLVSARQHPLRVYALLELGIGIFGILVLYGVPLIDRLYIATFAAGLPGILLRGAVAAICLLPPTLLMGASLPAIARRIDATPQGVSWLGFFYGGNIAGAVFGCLLAGFYLLRIYDMATATFFAASINAAVAVIAAVLAMVTAHHAPVVDAAKIRTPRPPGTWPVYFVIALSGLCALSAEVVWTRLLSLMLGATVYTFSIILGVFLLGLGLGSGAGSIVARLTANPRRALGWCQILLAAALAWTAFVLADSLPFWPIDPRLAKYPWFNFQIDLMRCMWAIFPATCLWGASFPLALAAVSSRDADPGRLVGEVYAANTLGAIAGALGASILLIPWIGTQQTQRLLVALSAIAAVTMFALVSRGWRRAAVVLASVAVAVGLVWTVSKVPWIAVAYGRRMAITDNPGDLLYMGEGMNSSIAVTEPEPGKRYFHVSGKVEASTESYDMRLQRMLGNLAALIQAKPRSVLVVGFGAGVTAGSFVPYAEIEKIVICELEKLIPPASTRFFAPENFNVLHDPRTKMVYDDARHFILTTPEKFDVITSDPIHPWVKGSSTLYSEEYFELCRRHLNPGGVVTQWVPLYESDPDTVKSEIATFFKVFPHGTIWANDIGGEGYDMVLLGQAEQTKINVDDLQQRLDRPEYTAVTNSLRSVGLPSATDLLATYAGSAFDLAPWLEHAEINQDLNLRLQYMAGMGLNHNNAPSIYQDMLAYRKYPDDLFQGSAKRLKGLKKALGATESSRP